MNLIEKTDAHMCRSEIALPREPHFYPSEASVAFTNKQGKRQILGNCMRKSYFRFTGSVESSPTSPYSEWIFALGKSVEQILVEQWKQMGIWVGNNIKFYDQKRNVSGELDCIIRDPETGNLICIEVKSFYGYNATKELIGNKSQDGKPKDAHLMQLLIYLDQTKDVIDHGKLIYYARDSADRTEFTIKLVKDADKTRFAINGKIDYRFTLDDVYDRYQQLANYVCSDELPPREFELVWGPEKVEEQFAAGEISKSAYEKWQKNPGKNPIGNWECRWCSFSKACWSK